MCCQIFPLRSRTGLQSLHSLGGDVDAQIQGHREFLASDPFYYGFKPESSGFLSRIPWTLARPKKQTPQTGVDQPAAFKFEVTETD